MGLSWGLAIATYDRHDVLMRSIRLAVAQTRPPKEIVIIDGSRNWEEGRKLTAQHMENADVALIYEPAERLSSAWQRNQAIRRSSADVLFLFDDDTLMYPDCAEAIMKVYEADLEGAVAGASAVAVTMPPDVAPQESLGTEHARPKRRSLRRAVRALLNADNIFVAYDEVYPDRPIPAAIAAMPIAPTRAMAGYKMTMRRTVALQEPFEWRLSRYASGEDSDMTYRASRHGCLINIFGAKVCHLAAPGGRLPPLVTTALGATNPLFLHRYHSTDIDRSRRLSRKLLWRRLIIQALKDLSRKDFRLPRAHGIAIAIQHLPKIMAMPLDELEAWYAEFQRALIEGGLGTGIRANKTAVSRT
jgi:GT2 family glycosyltransferase